MTSDNQKTTQLEASGSEVKTATEILVKLKIAKDSNSRVTQDLRFPLG